MKLRHYLHKQSWRSPTKKYVLFQLLFHRHSYIYPRAIVYSFQLVLFGWSYELDLLIRYKK